VHYIAGHELEKQNERLPLLVHGAFFIVKSAVSLFQTIAKNKIPETAFNYASYKWAISEEFTALKKI